MVIDPQIHLRYKRQWLKGKELKLALIACVILLILLQVITNFLLSPKAANCNYRHKKLSHEMMGYDEHRTLPTIYVITPTYERYVQKPELIRLSHTFMLVPNLHWIIVEDSEKPTNAVNQFVRRLKKDFDFQLITRLHTSTPKRYKRKPGQPSWQYPKGVWQRNRGLEWIKQNVDSLDLNGVIYFADDDNTYDLDLFNEMRHTKAVSVWPVALVGGLLVEKPIVRENKILSFNAMWAHKRPFPIDMAGFAISMQLFLSNPNANFSSDQRIGYLESHFLGQLISSWDDLEPKADSCNRVLVWHTKTKDPDLSEERKLLRSSARDLEL